MTKYNKIQLILITILFVHLTFALTFDEFADTYNYTQTEEGVSLTNITIANCLIDCENLTIILTTNVTFGDYSISAALDNQEYNINEYFFDGEKTINLVFYPEFSSNNLTLILIIKKDDAFAYSNTFENLDISNITFKSPEIESINDFLNDEEKTLSLNITLSRIISGEYVYSLYYSLNNIDHSTNELINISNNKPSIIPLASDFNGTLLIKKIEIGKYVFLTNYTTQAYYLSKFNIITDSLINKSLVIILENNQNLTILLLLYSLENEFITTTQTNTEHAYFNATIINNSERFGQFLIIYTANDTTKQYTTNFYSSDDLSRTLNETVIVDNTQSTFKTELSQLSSRITNSITNAAAKVTSEIFQGTNSTKNKIADDMPYSNDSLSNKEYTNKTFKSVSESENLESDNTLQKPKTSSKNFLTGNIILNSLNINESKLSLHILILLIISITLILYVLHKRKFSEVVIIK